MKKLSFAIMFILLLTTSIFSEDGIITKKSAFSVAETADRLEKVLNEGGMTVFTRINHSDGALKVKKELRPTIVIIFGNPKIGTPLMQSNQKIGLDLPQKALIWEDEKGLVWLSYNDPKYLEKRHGLEKQSKIFIKIENALKKFTDKATTKLKVKK